MKCKDGHTVAAPSAGPSNGDCEPKIDLNTVTGGPVCAGPDATEGGAAGATIDTRKLAVWITDRMKQAL